MGHRSFLDINHKYRSDIKSFDGNEEFNFAPTPPSGSQVLSQLQGFDFPLGEKKIEHHKEEKI